MAPVPGACVLPLSASGGFDPRFVDEHFLKGAQAFVDYSKRPLPPLPRGPDHVLVRSPEACDVGVLPEYGDFDEVGALWALIDVHGDGKASKLCLMEAVHRDPIVAALLLPGLDGTQVLNDEESFDAVDSVFDEIAGGKERMTCADLAAHLRRAAAERTANSREMHSIFALIDAEGKGSVSKMEFVASVPRSLLVANFLLPGMDPSLVLTDDECFDMVSAMFESISSGRRRITFADFKVHFRRLAATPMPMLAPLVDRGRTRVLVIGPGFGRDANLRQAALVRQAGYQVRWCTDLPEPQLGCPVAPYLNLVRAAIDGFRPHVLLGASRGGAYLVALWQAGFWRGPTVMLNAHPHCQGFPRGAQVVLAHGSNDEVYRRSRADLEDLVASGSDNSCFLYHTGNSGRLSSGALSRVGDGHCMDSLLLHDCLPCLIDAACAPEGAEVHMVRRWPERLSDTRREAERWLGNCPDRLRRLWISPHRRGADVQKLFQVPRSSEEYRRVATIFKAAPREPPEYLLSPQAAWELATIVRVERVENGLQENCGARPYMENVRRSFTEQGLEFEPGVHTCWAFHGADPSALESIVQDPLSGFQPLAAGTRSCPLWGLGTYFARDAKYVSDGQFCGPAPDGTRCMLLCLLMTGMPCLGDPEHRGVLPMRRRPHRYNSSVDSLSSPEIYVVQHPGAAYPAYLITFC